ncbi:MAG: DUF938 domain-containing protein [Pseudomonadota bacterium]
MSPADKPETPKVALEERAAEGGKLYSPSAARNRDAIRDAFLTHMPTTGRVLEIGSGTGEHAVHIASAAPDLTWRTSDPDLVSRHSIAAWIADAGLTNLAGPEAIDVTSYDWTMEREPLAGLVSINMIHIAPFEAAHALFAGAKRALDDAGKLFLYGPFSRNGLHAAASNEAFDASLKARDPRWGVRDIEHDLAPLAQENALRLAKVVEMPANNLSLVYAKAL